MLIAGGSFFCVCARLTPAAPSASVSPGRLPFFSHVTWTSFPAYFIERAGKKLAGGASMSPGLLLGLLLETRVFRYVTYIFHRDPNLI